MLADCLPRASVTVRVDGQALAEHHTENASASDYMTAITFVEANPGDKFEVHFHLDAGFPQRDRKEHVNAKLYVDGEWIGGKFLSTRELPGILSFEGLTETKAGVSTVKRLSFAEHTSVDGHVEASLAEKYAELGEIKVELFRCRKKTVSPPSTRSEGIKKDAIPEKAMKGRSVSSHAELGRSEVIPPVQWFEAIYPYGKDPMATYIFQYRSRKDLEIEDIVERPPSPVSLTERDPGQLTPDELREQVRLLRAERAVNPQVKQEVKREKRARERTVTLSDGANNEDDNDEAEVTITSTSDRRGKRARTSAGAVDAIDLTED